MGEQPDATAELAAMKTAFDALQPLGGRQAWQRALDWIVARLGEDERGIFVRNTLRIKPEPLLYCHDGNVHELFESAGEAAEYVAEYVDAYEVFEINGLAVVSQKFGVRFLIGDGQGEVEGDEVEWFDTRAEAEEFAVHHSDPDPMEGRGEKS